jgi:hypothetical protein
LVAVGCGGVVAGLSRLPTSYADEGDALLRLSWRVDGTMIEECRTRTPEELEALAPHMRTPEVCTGLGASYTLQVEVDDEEVAFDTIIPAGARRDRPVYVFREFELAPGEHDAVVVFRALTPRSAETFEPPPPLIWEGGVRLQPTEIALITIDSETGSLVRRRR